MTSDFRAYLGKIQTNMSSSLNQTVNFIQIRSKHTFAEVKNKLTESELAMKICESAVIFSEGTTKCLDVALTQVEEIDSEIWLVVIVSSAVIGLVYSCGGFPVLIELSKSACAVIASRLQGLVGLVESVGSYAMTLVPQPLQVAVSGAAETGYIWAKDLMGQVVCYLVKWIPQKYIQIPFQLVNNAWTRAVASYGPTVRCALTNASPYLLVAAEVGVAVKLAAPVIRAGSRQGRELAKRYNDYLSKYRKEISDQRRKNHERNEEGRRNRLRAKLDKTITKDVQLYIDNFNENQYRCPISNCMCFEPVKFVSSNDGTVYYYERNQLVHYVEEQLSWGQKPTNPATLEELPFTSADDIEIDMEAYESIRKYCLFNDLLDIVESPSSSVEGPAPLNPTVEMIKTPQEEQHTATATEGDDLGLDDQP